MARAGRKRKPHAARSPNTGKVLAPDKEEIKGVAKWNRLKEAVARNMEDPRWGSELGRWHYQGKIVAIQREAGERLLEIVTDHRKYGMIVDGEHIRLPKADPKISQMERKSPGREVEDVDPERIHRAQDNFDKAFAGIIDSSRDGIAIWKAITKLCVENLVLTYPEEMLAKKGLTRLAVILGLTSVTKIVTG